MPNEIRTQLIDAALSAWALVAPVTPAVIATADEIGVTLSDAELASILSDASHEVRRQRSH